MGWLSTIFRKRSKSVPIEDAFDCPRHIIHIGHPIDMIHQTACFVNRQDRRCFRPVFSHARAHRFLIVIRPALEFGRSANIAYPGHLGLFEAIMITFVAFGAGKTPGDALDQRIFINIKLYNFVQGPASLGKQCIQRGGLWRGARIAIENDAFGGIGLIQPLTDDAAHDLVGNQFASFHDRLCFQADRRSCFHRRAQHIAGRKLHHPPVILEPRRLGSLSGPRRPQQYYIHALFSRQPAHMVIGASPP